MSDYLDNLKNGVEQAREQSKELIPWLPDPYICDHCGAYCEPSEEFVDDAGHVGYTEVWVCPECGARYYRERV